ILSPTTTYKNLVSDDVPSLNFNKLAKGSDLKFVKDKKLFQTGAVKKAIKPTEKVKKGPVICTEETSKKSSSLPITLLNTIVLQDSVKSIASVQVRSDLFDLREGEQIENMAKIDKITRLKLIIKNLNSDECENVMASEAKEMLSLPTNINVLSPSESKKFVKQKKSIEGIKNDGNKFEISKKLLKSKMSNISEILTQAQGITITNPDGSMSFKVVNIEPGSIYNYLGIQDNDVITQINGNKINNLNEVMNLFGRIQNIDQLNLMIERNGVQTPLDYELK
ncbi:PDZ domain-containing protein, partial [Bacteriovoracaceae bacterium]|nr:PDZ domain-containing protein [Bacteriovoracaceae bacterium]